MKRKASVSLSSKDLNQGVLTYAHDGENELEIIYSQSQQRIDSFSAVPPYGKVLVDGKDEELIIFRLKDDSIIVLLSDRKTKIRDYTIQENNRRWCWSYACIHILNLSVSDRSKYYSIDGRNPYRLCYVDGKTHNNIKRYVVRNYSEKCSEIETIIRFSICTLYGNGNECLLKFPIKRRDYDKFITDMILKFLYFDQIFLQMTGLESFYDIKRSIFLNNNSVFHAYYK